jgi:rRNA-processing protein FCF1
MKKMKQVLLDTSFILTAVRQRIDFFEEIESLGLQILIPEQVIRELQGLKASVALSILNKKKFKKIDLQQKEVDKGIISYSKSHIAVIIATLDSEIKKKTRNRKLVIRQKKKIEVI